MASLDDFRGGLLHFGGNSEAFGNDGGRRGACSLAALFLQDGPEPVRFLDFRVSPAAAPLRRFESRQPDSVFTQQASGGYVLVQFSAGCDVLIDVLLRDLRELLPELRRALRRVAVLKRLAVFRTSRSHCGRFVSPLAGLPLQPRGNLPRLTRRQERKLGCVVL